MPEKKEEKSGPYYTGPILSFLSNPANARKINIGCVAWILIAEALFWVWLYVAQGWSEVNWGIARSPFRSQIVVPLYYITSKAPWGIIGFAYMLRHPEYIAPRGRDWQPGQKPPKILSAYNIVATAISAAAIFAGGAVWTGWLDLAYWAVMFVCFYWGGLISGLSCYLSMFFRAIVWGGGTLPQAIGSSLANGGLWCLNGATMFWLVESYRVDRGGPGGSQLQRGRMLGPILMLLGEYLNYAITLIFLTTPMPAAIPALIARWTLYTPQALFSGYLGLIACEAAIRARKRA